MIIHFLIIIFCIDCILYFVLIIFLFFILFVLLVFTDKYSEAPSTADLMVYVACKIPTKWYQLGIMLHIKTTILDTFAKEVADHDQVRLSIMVFTQWEKEQKVPFTWETIISTLETLGEKKTATELKEWLNL